ncbi:MAG TPA: hypothetical protein VKM94_09220 [Blastocatellia bacterium]|nr:hypothetical protein [Blastocatellia bacterium]
MRFVVLAIASLLLMSATDFLGQTRSSQKPETFAAFLETFRAAVQSGDKEKVASMTQLPFLFEGEELNHDGFIAKFDALFDTGIKKCFLKARPVRDGAYFEVPCTETSFMFRKVSGKFKFVEIGVND